MSDQLTRAAVERLLANSTFAADGCLIPAQKPGANGYLYISVGPRTSKKNILATRAVFECLNGMIPAQKVVRHSCRARHCVNIEHLFTAPPPKPKRSVPLRELRRTVALHKEGHTIRAIAGFLGLSRSAIGYRLSVAKGRLANG